jgi:alpha-2-macroglobulin
VRVEWPATVTDAPQADLEFAVQGGGYMDASRPPLGQPPDQTLPIYRYSAPDTVGTAGELNQAGQRTEVIALPRRYDATKGQLQVEAAPSLAGALTDGLSYLEHYPYEGNEQLVSRFLPNLFTYRALQASGLSDPALESRVMELLNYAVSRLVARQNADGGWGWWPGQKSDVNITAYVTFGLSEATKIGFPVAGRVSYRGGGGGESAVLRRALDYLQKQVQSPLPGTAWELNRRAFVVYVLSTAGSLPADAPLALYSQRQHLDLYARAFILVALAKARPDAPEARTLLDELLAAAQMTATGAHWVEAQRDDWNMNSDLRSTAINLSALVRLAPEHPLLPEVVRWLMTARQAHGAWASTQETAWALIALTDWLTASKELSANYDFAVALNGQALASRTVATETVRENTQLTVAVGQLLANHANRLVLERGPGDGRLYYTARLTLYQEVANLPPLDRGISLSRQYLNPGGSCQGICPPIAEAPVGTTFFAKLTLTVPRDTHYLLVEDFIPAGTEVVNLALKTSAAQASAYYVPGAEAWRFIADIRDEKVALFAEDLPAGTYEYTYQLYASVPGQYNVIPPLAQEFYFPEVYGRGSGSTFTVKP